MIIDCNFKYFIRKQPTNNAFFSFVLLLYHQMILLAYFSGNQQALNEIVNANLLNMDFINNNTKKKTTSEQIIVTHIITSDNHLLIHLFYANIVRNTVICYIMQITVQKFYCKQFGVHFSSSSFLLFIGIHKVQLYIISCILSIHCII